MNEALVNRLDISIWEESPLTSAKAAQRKTLLHILEAALSKDGTMSVFQRAVLSRTPSKFLAYAELIKIEIQQGE